MTCTWRCGWVREAAHQPAPAGSAWRVLDLHHWHVTDAAAALGVMRYALARAIKKHRRREAH